MAPFLICDGNDNLKLICNGNDKFSSFLCIIYIMVMPT